MFFRLRNSAESAYNLQESWPKHVLATYVAVCLLSEAHKPFFWKSVHLRVSKSPAGGSFRLTLVNSGLQHLENSVTYELLKQLKI